MGKPTPVQIHQLFQPLYTSPKRYFFLTGGRGSLKTTSVHDFIVRLTYQKGHGVLFTRYTMVSAEKSIIPEFQIAINRLGAEADFNITKNVVTNLKTESFVYFSGIKTSSGDQQATLKSIAGITTWVIEEGEDFKDEKAFDAIDDSIRTSSIQNRVIWIQNPTTKEHFIYKRWIEPKNKKVEIEGYDITVSALNEVEHIHSTYHLAAQLGYLSEDWLYKANKHEAIANEAENKYSTWYYHNYIGGWLEKAEGVIFENWEEGEFNRSLPYCYGLDFGFFPDPTAMIKIAVDSRNKLVYMDEKVYGTKLSTDAVISNVKQYIDRGTDLIVADHDKRIIHELEAKGLNIVFASKGPDSVVADIRDMQDYKFIVTPESTNLKKELNSYAWNDKKSSIPIDADNHLLDASRYAFRRLAGERKRGLIRMNR